MSSAAWSTSSASGAWVPAEILVVHGVVAHVVPVHRQLAQKIAPRQILGPVAHDVLAHDEEHRFQVAAIQFVQNERRALQVRAVVEGQQHQALCGRTHRAGGRFTGQRNQIAREGRGEVDRDGPRRANLARFPRD